MCLPPWVARAFAEQPRAGVRPERVESIVRALTPHPITRAKETIPR